MQIQGIQLTNKSLYKVVTNETARMSTYSCSQECTSLTKSHIPERLALYHLTSMDTCLPNHTFSSRGQGQWGREKQKPQHWGGEHRKQGNTCVSGGILNILLTHMRPGSAMLVCWPGHCLLLQDCTVRGRVNQKEQSTHGPNKDIALSCAHKELIRSKLSFWTSRYSHTSNLHK